jgi:hypothetical protein
MSWKEDLAKAIEAMDIAEVIFTGYASLALSFMCSIAPLGRSSQGLSQKGGEDAAPQRIPSLGQDELRRQIELRDHGRLGLLLDWAGFGSLGQFGIQFRAY